MALSVFFSGPLGGKPPPPQTVTRFVRFFWMFFTFPLPTKAISPQNYISRKNPDGALIRTLGTRAVTPVATNARGHLLAKIRPW